MIVFVCSSHAANLVVQAGICGKITPRPVQTDRLLGTCSRLFKYLVPDYQSEFHRNLRRHVVDKLEVITSSPEVPLPESSVKLQDLYGKRALPDEFVAFWTAGFDTFQHASKADHAGAAREQAYHLLSKYLLRVDD
eukprot:251139-Pyramimonas_sp.AAC.1